MRRHNVSKPKNRKTTIAAVTGLLGLGAVAAHDLIQKQRGVLRNYPVLGHARFMLNKIRPQIQQYFIERDWDGRPFNRTTRELIYARSRDERAKSHLAPCTILNAQVKNGSCIRIPRLTHPRLRRACTSAETTVPSRMTCRCSMCLR